MAYIIYLFSDCISRLRSPVIQKPLQTKRATSNVESVMYGGLLRDEQCAQNICGAMGQSGAHAHGMSRGSNAPKAQSAGEVVG